MEDLRFDIYWPRLGAPDIAETRYSYRFCRRTSRGLCAGLGERCAWYDYEPDAAVGDILRRGSGDIAVIVGDPEVVIAPGALQTLGETARRLGPGSVVGPVFNETGMADQKAAMTTAYLNVATYLEVVDAFAQGEVGDADRVDILDPACIAFIRRPAPSDIEDIGVGPLIDRSETFVDRRALVHCFGQYYDAPRDDLIGLIPDSVERILDVGCAKGGYARRLKEVRGRVHVTGVELNPIMAAQAREFCDVVITSPVETAEFPHDFDLVNCGDVLEHLEDPWAFLERVWGVLRPGGYLVLSVPNVGHWTVVRDLLRGEFTYLPLGITCIGHIRWFTETSVRDAITAAGFEIDVFRREQVAPTKGGEAFIGAVRALGMADETSLRTNEFLVRAVKR